MEEIRTMGWAFCTATDGIYAQEVPYITQHALLITTLHDGKAMAANLCIYHTEKCQCTSLYEASAT